MRALLPILAELKVPNWISLFNRKELPSGNHPFSKLEYVAFAIANPFQCFLQLPRKLFELEKNRNVTCVHLIPNSLQDLLTSFLTTFYFETTVIYVMDDFPNSNPSLLRRTLSRTLLYWIYRRAAVRVVASRAMAKEFEARTKFAADLICTKTWPRELMTESQRDFGGKKIRVAWIGSFQSYYTQPLNFLANCLTNHHQFSIDLYSQSPPPKNLLGAHVKYIGFIDDEHVLSTLADYDFGLVTYSFDSDTANFMRLSFPSKLADYQSAALPVIVFAPKTLCFLEEEKALTQINHVDALNINAVDELISKLRAVSAQQYSSWSSASLSRAKSDFDRGSTADELSRLIAKASKQ